MSHLQKDADRAVVVAVTSRAVFESAADDGGDVYGVGVAFPLLQVRIKCVNWKLFTTGLLKCVTKIEKNTSMKGRFEIILIHSFTPQALHKVNERLLEESSAESLLFDVILITTDDQQQQQSSRITSSTRHYGNHILITSRSTKHYSYLWQTFSRQITVNHWSPLKFVADLSCHYHSLAGLEVSRFCFSSQEDFTESLLKNNVQLFLTTDRDEVLRASQNGQNVSSSVIHYICMVDINPWMFWGFEEVLLLITVFVWS